MGFRQFAAVLLIQVGNVKSVRLFRKSNQFISTHRQKKWKYENIRYVGLKIYD